MAFGLHQGSEYVAALYLGLSAAHLGGDASTVCLVVAVLIAGLALVTRGPLGVGPLPRSLHYVADLCLIAALAATPFVFDLGADATPAVLLLSLAVAMIVLVKATDYRGAPRPEQPNAVHVMPAPSDDTPSDEAIRKAARVAGVAVGRFRDNAPRAAGEIVGRYRRRRAK